jgi:hypothetical protein
LLATLNRPPLGQLNFFCSFTKHRITALQHRRHAAPLVDLMLIFLIDSQKYFCVAAIRSRKLRLLTAKMFSESLIAKQ